MNDKDKQEFVGELVKANIMLNKAIWAPDEINQVNTYVQSAIDILQHAKDKYLAVKAIPDVHSISQARRVETQQKGESKIGDINPSMVMHHFVPEISSDYWPNYPEAPAPKDVTNE